MKKFLLTTALALLPAAAYADTVDFSNILASWSNGVPPANPNYFSNGTSNPQVYWGTGNPSLNNPDGDSGYTFQSPASQPVTAIVPPSPSTPPFVLGTFQHVNFAIPTGTSITGIDLTITADVAINSVFQANEAFKFHFTHDETPNADNPCRDGGTVGVGVDGAGCADHVTVNALADTAFFDIGANHYTVNIIGFEQGSVTTSSFWTAENQVNTAYLIGDVELLTDVINPTGGVPELSTWAYGVMGFAFMGFAGYRSRKGRAALA